MTVGVGAKEDDFFRVELFDDDLEIKAELIGDPVYGIAGIQEHVLADLVGGNRGRAHGDRLLIAGGSARGRGVGREGWCNHEWHEGHEWGVAGEWGAMEWHLHRERLDGRRG